MSSSRTPLRVLVVSSLFPSVTRPRHGIFVETRLRQLIAGGEVEAKVVAPVPWFPSRNWMFGRYAALAATPANETRYGVAVSYPRYLMLPRIGMRMQPSSMASVILGAAKRLRAEGFEFDVMDLHYFYPDGVAGSRVARTLGIPFVITARGSDLNVVAHHAFARRAIVQASKEAARVLCVSGALREKAISLGIPADRTELLRNGVDTDLFRRLNQSESRRALGLADVVGPLLVCVGNLAPEKGHRLAVQALRDLPTATLLIIGNGAEARAIADLARTLKLTDRIRIMSAMPQDHLPAAYSAASVCLLPSLREGWPNVVLESLSCGTPVVAMRVGAVPDILNVPEAGRVCDSREPGAFAEDVRRVLCDPPNPDAVRRHALHFGWEPVVARYREVLAMAANMEQHAPAQTGSARSREQVAWR